jgi:hypothetical protein
MIVQFPKFRVRPNDADWDPVVTHLDHISHNLQLPCSVLFGKDGFCGPQKPISETQRNIQLISESCLR